MKWFENSPKKLDEKQLIKDSDFSPFEWILVNGVWVNMYRGWEKTETGIFLLEND